MKPIAYDRWSGQDLDRPEISSEELELKVRRRLEDLLSELMEAWEYADWQLREATTDLIAIVKEAG